TTSPAFPFSSNPAPQPSEAHPAGYYGKFDPQKGLLFAQYLVNPSYTIALSPSGGPVVPGDFGSGFEIRQYASDGVTVVYDYSLPSLAPSSVNLTAAPDGVILTGSTTNARLPLHGNVHVCNRLLTAGAIDSSFLIRIDQSGALIQSTWLGS